MVETDPQKLVTYTQSECRAKAAAKLVEAQTYLNDSDAESTQLALAAAQLWATLALSAPKYDAPVPLESQPIPGVQLFSVDSPEPDVNPGEILVDPMGGMYPYLLRLDGHKWLWCDSLAHAEAEGFADARLWEEVMAGGLHRVRRATEREQVEFRNGTGGAALDLVRRLLSTLAGLARDNGHPHIALWLANCDERAHLSFSTWEWPSPAPSAPPPPADADEPPEVCSAHGRAQCPSCSRSIGRLNADGTCPECASFQTTGMHWDTCPHRDRSPLPGGEPASIPQALSHAAELADAAGKKRTAAWLRACVMAYGRGQEWPDAPAYKGLVVHVENPQPDLERLAGTTLTRLRDQIQALITERAQADAKVTGERWRAGTGGGIPDYPRDVRPPGGGGAARWREG